MADESLSLLFKIRGDAAGAKQATAETRAAVAQLRSQLGGEFGAIQKAGESAFQNLGNSLNVFVGQRIPLVGGAFIRVSENLRNLGGDSKKAEQELAGLTKTIEGISASTGKSTQSVTAFLTSFVQLETQAKRDAAAIETFGAATAQTLIPELEKAGTQLASVTTSAEGAGIGIAGMAGPIGIAVVGIAATIASVALLTKGLYDLTVSTADWQGKLFDMSQQVGVSVETLNALEIVAGKTGGSIESIGQSLVIFQGHLDEAQDASSKSGLKFRELGISVGNTEQSFRDALRALAAMPEGFHQTNEAAELFGRRGGKQVLAIIKETNGDIDSAVTKLGGLARVTAEESRVADEFNDTLKDLGTLIRGASALVVKDVIPALKDTGKIIQQNQGEIRILAGFVGDLANALNQQLQGALAAIILPLKGVTGVVDSIRSAFGFATSAVQEFKGAIAGVGGSARPEAEVEAQLGAGLRPDSGKNRGLYRDPVKSSGGGGGAARAKAVDDFAEFIKKQELAIKEATETADKYTKEIDKLAEALQKKGKAFTDPMRAEVEANAATLRAIDKETERRKKLAELQAETDKWLRQIVQDTNDAAEGTDQYDKKLRELVAAASAVGLTFDDNTLKLIALNVQLARAPELVEQFDKMLDKFNQDLQINRDIVSGLPDKYRPFLEVLRETEEKNRKFTEKTDATIGPPPPLMTLKRDDTGLSEFEKLQRDINEHFEKGSLAANVFTASLESMQVVAGGLAEGIGNVLHSFVLFGSAGTTFRKFAAEVIASVAAMAASKAIFELAEGIAALARAFFGDPKAGAEATLHFKAAAIYGAVAAVAAVSGRAIAGNAFAQGGSASGGGGESGGSGGGSRSNSSPQVADVNRRANASTLTINLGLKEGIVADHFRRDWDLNGVTRLTVKTDKD